MSSNVIVPQSILETLGDASRAGIITWDSVQAYQARLMPRCVNHPDRSAPVYYGDALCTECAMAAVAARKEES